MYYKVLGKSLVLNWGKYIQLICIIVSFSVFCLGLMIKIMKSINLFQGCTLFRDLWYYSPAPPHNCSLDFRQFTELSLL